MTSQPEPVDFPSDGGVTIAAYRWDPEGEPKAIAQLAHGVGEYLLRYAPLAERLAAKGYVVYGHDHRGRGNTATSPEQYGVLGEEGWGLLVSDYGRMSRVAVDARPGLPLGLVAHSLGSFAAQQYLLDHSGDVSAVALSGTAAIDLLAPAMNLDEPMDLSGFNAPFEPARTEFDWLSRDDAQVDAYIADPMCGFGLDVPGGKAMFAGAQAVADPAKVARMRDDLPVYVVVGELDPINADLALVEELVRRYDEAGLADLTLVVYPGARHEVFNETNREEVFAGLVTWLDARLT